MAKEIAKLADKQKKLVTQLQKLNEMMSSAAYDKVPLGIRNNNTEKVNGIVTFYLFFIYSAVVAVIV